MLKCPKCGNTKRFVSVECEGKHTRYYGTVTTDEEREAEDIVGSEKPFLDYDGQSYPVGEGFLMEISIIECAECGEVLAEV